MTRELRQRNRGKRLPEQEHVDQAVNMAKEITPHVLEERPLLQCGKGGEWHAFTPPEKEAHMEVVADVSPRHAAQLLKQSNLKELSEQWHARHRTIPAVAKNRSVPAVSFKRCSLGKCVCQGQPRILCQRVLQWLRGLPRVELVSGLLVVSWQPHYLPDEAFAGGKRPQPDTAESAYDTWPVGTGVAAEPLYTHLASVTLSPFMVMLAEVEPVTPADFSLVARTPFRFKQKLDMHGHPHLFSIFEWVLALDTSLALDVSSRRIDDSLQPVGQVDGSVLLHAGNENYRLWRGELAERQKARQQKPVHALLSEPRSERSCQLRHPNPPA